MKLNKPSEYIQTIAEEIGNILDSLSELLNNVYKSDTLPILALIIAFIEGVEDYFMKVLYLSIITIGWLSASAYNWAKCKADRLNFFGYLAKRVSFWLLFILLFLWVERTTINDEVYEYLFNSYVAPPIQDVNLDIDKVN